MSTARPSPPPELGDDGLLLLHTMRIRGAVSSSDAAEILHRPLADAESILGGLRGVGLTAAWMNGLHRLTPAGEAMARERLPRIRSAADQAAVDAAFLPLNSQIKQLISRYQTDELDNIDLTVSLYEFEPICAEAESVVFECLDHNTILRQLQRRRLHSLQRIADGDLRYIADPRLDSYHSVWSDWHRTLDLARHQPRV